MDDAAMPDLSHLSAEEREIIEQVFKRQREEENKESQMSMKASEELEEIDKQINEKKEMSRKLVGTQDDAICQICRKTKFADGIGHKCFYCQLRSCARCGGRSQSKNKAIWACSLCQKRQQILAKTGKWFQPDDPQQKMSTAGMNSPMQSPSQKASMDSTAQGLTQAMQQPQQMLANQMQSQSQPQSNQMNQQQSSPASGLPMQGLQGQGRNGPQTNMNMNMQQQQQQRINEQPQQRRETMRKEGSVTGMGVSMQHRQQSSDHQGGLQRQKSIEQDQCRSGQQTSSYGNGTIPNRRASQQIQQNVQHTPQRKYTEQPTTHRNTDNRVNFDNRPTEEWQGSSVNRNDNRDQNIRYDQNQSTNDHKGSSIVDSNTNRIDNRNKQRVTEDSYSSSQFNGTRQPQGQGQGQNRQSGQSGQGPGMGTCEPTPVPIPPAVPQHNQQQSPLIANTATTATQAHNRKKSRLHRQLHSMSSSEDDPVASTSLAPDDQPQRIPNECTSEKDLLRYIYAGEKTKPAKRGVSRGLLPDSLVSSASPAHPSGSLFGPCPGSSNSSSSSNPAIISGDLLSAKIRTYLSHPVTWQPSADQRRLIGHMILSRTDLAANGDLGLKVVGGRRVDTGRLGAFITQVKVGSVADTIGRLRAGDEVLEWNGQPLQNLTFDQVYEIIAASKNEGQVELIVSRSASIPGGDDFLNMQPQPARQLPYLLEDYYSPSPSPMLPPMNALTHSQSALLPQIFSQQQQQQQQQQHGQHSPRHKYLPYLHYDAGSAHFPMHMGAAQGSTGKGHIFGKIEISLLLVPEERKLCVRVEGAFDLPSRPDGIPRNAYAKLFLLPDRSERSRRQTSIVAESCNPQWSEVFYYKGITEYMLAERVLEITVWDFDKYDTNTYLGEALVDLGRVDLDGQIITCTLVDMDEESPLRYKLRYQKYSHLPQRPHSEMGRYQHVPYEMDEMYDYGRETIRRSRTYDRGRQGPRRGGTPLRNVEEDWTANQSGYLSDHGYSQPARGYRRRPRSATTMRPMNAAEMSAARMYRGITEDMWSEEPAGYAQPPPMGRTDGSMENYDRVGMATNGKLEEQQEHGSDASETVSIQSGGSIPVVRTVNRRMPLDEMEEYPSMEEASQSMGMGMRGMKGQQMQAQSAAAQQQALKERKKSLMTRFIPGRGAAGGEGKRTGFARSEEVGIPNINGGGGGEPQRLQTTANAPFLKQASKESTDSQHSDNWLPVLPDGPLGTFVENLGPGQVVGRQVLASPVLGEIQLAIMAGRAGIDVEIIRAKNLVVKPGVKIGPAPYVKVYLMEGKQCIQKAKTNPAKKSTAPVFQQHLIFNESPKYKMLQVTVLGDYGRMERKTFMGIAQIRLDDLQLGSEPVIGWYKLFHSSSLAGSGPVRKDSESSLSAMQQQQQ